MKNLFAVFRAFLLACFFLPTLAFANKVLDKVEIVQAKSETEIHIEFLTQVRYVRHFPNNAEASRIQIFLEFPQEKSISSKREFINSPSSDSIPSFIVNYPDQKANSIGVRFKLPIKFSITPDNSGRGIVIRVPKELKATDTEPLVEVTQSVDNAQLTDVPDRGAGMTDNDYAAMLVADAKAARGQGDHPKAIQLLNATLALPTNNYSQEAQELIGNSREKMGEKTKAKAEYEAYLKLYPKGEGAERVRARIAAIERTLEKTSTSSVGDKKVFKDIHENTVYGSWNQYYYDAHSHNYPNSGKNSTTHDQSSLVSAIDLTARFRHNEWDNKIVFRDTQTMNFLPDSASRNRLQAAYVEINNKDSDFLARLGRQNGNSGGVLGRFDGAWFRYGFTPQYKLNFVAGTLDEYDIDYRRHFYGLNLDIGPINEKWSGNAFFIEQTVDHFIDRRGVGGELRYFDMGKSVYSLVDYDTFYDRLNTAMVQGNWQATEKTNYNMLVETRKSPVLQLINSLSDTSFSLSGQPVTSPRQAARLGATESLLRDSAIKQTLDTQLYLLGVTHQLTPRWQLGGDIQKSRVAGSPGATQGAIDLALRNFREANGGLEPDALTIQNLNQSFAGGNTYTYHIQAVGTNTLFKDDTSVISYSLINGPSSLVNSLVLTNVMVPVEKWRLDSSLKLLKIDSDPSIVQYVVSPTLRASYKLREKATIEAEVGLEVTNEDDAVNGHSRTFRDFSFIGYRLDI
ncbi:MAG TPA: hypothetical protein PL131_13375 [Methylotenera sp.]|nr:hypothetical protein [Methylotenera sp.]HPN02125.1 hypothetical protein [Methylotenera sp.]